MWPFKSELQKAHEALELRRLQFETKAIESYQDYFDAYVDPRGAYRDDSKGLDELFHRAQHVADVTVR